MVIFNSYVKLPEVLIMFFVNKMPNAKCWQMMANDEIALTTGKRICLSPTDTGNALFWWHFQSVGENKSS